MDFVQISDVLVEYDLQKPHLTALHPDTDLYKTSVFQPEGLITANDSCVKNQDSEKMSRLLNGFFSNAKESNCHLAVVPEYCCPWTTIQNLLTNELLPDEDKLWIIGCESITKDSLATFKRSFENRFTIIHEDVSSREGEFLDPVCYLFATRDQANNLKFVVLLQFKTRPMGDAPEHFERDRLILGNDIYVFTNRGTNSIRLVTFICSDVLGIPEAKIDEIVHNLLIVHIQLNPNPRNHTFSTYRKYCFDRSWDYCEVLCVNWAKNVNCNASTPNNWENISGSAIYVKSARSNLTDIRINSNHFKGLYFTFLKNFKTCAHFLNYSPGIFHFRNSKVWQHYATAQQAGRTGPEARQAFAWSAEANRWNECAVSDGFEEACARINGDLTALRTMIESPINIERMLSLSHGLACEVDWYNPVKQKFFHIDERELVNRISFAQDSHAESVGSRDQHLRSFATLSHIVSEAETLPIMIDDLRGNCSLRYEINQPHRNLHSNSNGAPATIVYLGENPPPTEVQRVYANLEAIFSELRQDRYRLVICFRTISGDIEFYPPDLRPMADSDPSQTIADITGD